MGHITSIGAGMFTDLSVTTDANEDVAAAIAAVKAQPSTAKAQLEPLFATELDNDTKLFERIKNVREFPAMGVAPNVVNVPVFGQKVSKQTQGQSDAPSMELQINYVASDWAEDKDLMKMVGDGQQRVFRFTILNSKPFGFTNANICKLKSDTSKPCENTEYYFWGKMEALQVTPQLTDATTATLTISIQSDFFGAFTIDPVSSGSGTGG